MDIVDFLFTLLVALFFFLRLLIILYVPKRNREDKEIEEQMQDYLGGQMIDIPLDQKQIILNFKQYNKSKKYIYISPSLLYKFIEEKGAELENIKINERTVT